MDRKLIVIDTTGIVIFDGLQGVAWKLLMKRSVPANGIRFRHIASGQVYSFIFQQDGTGGHTFTWATALVPNAARIDLRPYAVTVQHFIGDVGGRLEAIIPGTWSKTA